MRIKGILSGAVVFGLVMVLGAINVKADQITLSDTCAGTLTVSGGTPGAWAGSVSGCQGSFDSSVLGNLLTDSTWSLNTSTGAFSFGDGSNSLTGTLTLGSVTLAGSLALLQGTMDVTGITGDLPLSVYSVGGVYFWDITLNKCTTGEAASPASAPVVASSCSVSSGEVPVPEPGSLALFGSGLVGLAGYLRRKIARS